MVKRLLAIFMCFIALAPRLACAQLASRPAAGPFVQREELPVLPLAAEGYCAVTLHDSQQWVRGDARVAAQFDGRQYVFAGEREREIFAAAPTVYAPVLSGDCVVAFAETGKRVPGSVKFGLIQGGRTYFFSGDVQRAAFVAEPARFANADLADGGRCLVTRVEERRDVPGLPETAVLNGGMRRLFAGAHQQSLYLRQPDRYNATSANPPLAAGQAAGQAPGQVAATGGGWRPSSPTPDLAPGARGGEGSAGAPPGGGGAGREGQDNSLSPDPTMGGYCPVTIRQKGLWTRGRYDFRVEVDKLIFFTAGQAEQDAFLANPTQFIPAAGGDCVVSLGEYGKRARGSVFHASQYKERLFLFVDAESKAMFDAAPERYAGLDLAADGNCVVTLDEDQRKQPGFAEFAAWRDGLLYRFAGAEQLAKFLKSPEKYAVRAPER